MIKRDSVFYPILTYFEQNYKPNKKNFQLRLEDFAKIFVTIDATITPDSVKDLKDEGMLQMVWDTVFTTLMGNKAFAKKPFEQLFGSTQRYHQLRTDLMGAFQNVEGATWQKLKSDFAEFKGYVQKGNILDYTTNLEIQDDFKSKLIEVEEVKTSVKEKLRALTLLPAEEVTTAANNLTLSGAT